MNSQAALIIPDRMNRLVARPAMKWMITLILFLGLVLFYVLWRYNLISLAEMLGLYLAALGVYVAVLAFSTEAPLIQFPSMEASVSEAHICLRPAKKKSKIHFVPTPISSYKKCILIFAPYFTRIQDYFARLCAFPSWAYKIAAF